MKQGETIKFDNIALTFRVLSFDFAENLNYTFNPQQVNPKQFKIAIKYSVFEIHNGRGGNGVGDLT